MLHIRTKIIPLCWSSYAFSRDWNFLCYFRILRHASATKCENNTENFKLCFSNEPNSTSSATSFGELAYLSVLFALQPTRLQEQRWSFHPHGRPHSGHPAEVYVSSSATLQRLPGHQLTTNYGCLIISPLNIRSFMPHLGIPSRTPHIAAQLTDQQAYDSKDCRMYL